MMRVLLLLLACGCSEAKLVPDAAPADSQAADSPAPCPDADVPSIVCGDGGACAAIAIDGDSPQGIGTFHGYADPAIAHDPAAPNVEWLAYSFPHIVAGKDTDGGAVNMAAVSTHLAKSTTSGATITYASELWPAVPTLDPEGSGENGLISSETPSLAAANGIWYGAHLRYFLRPLTGYNPKYGTSWVVHVGAASSPDQLGGAPEAVLGVSTTASVYKPTVRLDTLSPALSGCALLNNPMIVADASKLYLVVECVAFNGMKRDDSRSATHVFSTKPSGPAPGWTWTFVGTLADHALATELGADTLIQPDVSRSSDGTFIALFNPALGDPNAATGLKGTGCRALELVSLDPPVIARDCAGRAKLRAFIGGAGYGSCTHDVASATGVIATIDGDGQNGWMIFSTKLHP